MSKLGNQISHYVHYFKTIGVTSNQPVGRGFSAPVDISINHRTNQIYVLNRGKPQLNRIGVCNLDEEYLFEFSKNGNSPGEFLRGTGIAINSQGNVFLTDEELNKIIVWSENGEFLSQWGSTGSDPGQLNGPGGIAIDPSDNIFITDQNNHRIQKFNSHGEFLATFGTFGNGDGQLNMPWGIHISPDNHIWVADWRNDRIQKFTIDGKFVLSFGESGNEEGQFYRPSGVTVDNRNNVYVSDWGNERVQILSEHGSHIQTLRGEATLSKWANEFLEANLDEKRTRAISNLKPDLPSHLNSPYLISSQTEEYFWSPTSVNLDSEGKLYVTESSRHRIQIYKPNNLQ
ncbi:MAG: hypothetical protein CL735_05915 [Chloroflexi bacterium]|nr:hypothetical protein [Chloroflexota bacterium]|tara:strand:+ start:77736 stop:78767 length:1032 start_codon:yes stop_codon:yes gene_type:complete